MSYDQASQELGNLALKLGSRDNITVACPHLSVEHEIIFLISSHASCAHA